jgi:hypothetical protein
MVQQRRYSWETWSKAFAKAKELGSSSACNPQESISLFGILLTGPIFALFQRLRNQLSTIASYQKSSIG